MARSSAALRVRVIRPSSLQPFEHRGQRRRIQLQRSGDRLDRQRTIDVRLVVVPQREHHEVLRMGQPERFEQRAVHRQHRAVGDRQREAHLPFEGQGIDVCLDDGHATTLPFR